MSSARPTDSATSTADLGSRRCSSGSELGREPRWLADADGPSRYVVPGSERLAPRPLFDPASVPLDGIRLAAGRYSGGVLPQRPGDPGSPAEGGRVSGRQVPQLGDFATLASHCGPRNSLPSPPPRQLALSSATEAAGSQRGTLTKWNSSQGFGFLKGPGPSLSSGVFVHSSQLVQSATAPQIGDQVLPPAPLAQLERACRSLSTSRRTAQDGSRRSTCA